MIQVNSYTDLIAKIKAKDKAYLLLFKKGNEKSDCAYNNVLSASKNIDGINPFYADVNSVRDIHTQYKITSVPTLIEFESGSFKNVVKGCSNSVQYKAMFEDAIYFAEIKKDNKPSKRVTVYSTPSCSWCNTIKTYLRQHKIRFADIDVSKNQQAADEMVKRSGQRGVPQTDINGEIIVGFNKSRINELLDIKG